MILKTSIKLFALNLKGLPPVVKHKYLTNKFCIHKNKISK